MARPFKSGWYYKDGVPFDVFFNKHKQDCVKNSSNRPNYEGDEPVAQAMSATTAAINQPSCQTSSVAGTLSLGIGNETHSTEAGTHSETLNSKPEPAKTVDNGIYTNVTGPMYTFKWKKLSRKKRNRYHLLKKEGIPQDEARKLCRLPWDTLEKMNLKNLKNRNIFEDPEGPANKNLKMSAVTDKPNTTVGPTQDLGHTKAVGQTNDVEPTEGVAPLRVGITNSTPMTEEQMKLLHSHLILAIKEQCSEGAGPEFLGFSHKTGWVLVTCVNQRSKDWLVHAVPYLEPWCGAKLSIIPEKELPQPPRAVAFIPDSEAGSAEEAIKLLKAQNKGLNTELWEVRCQKLEGEGRLMSFTIDDLSADALREQKCQAAIGFKVVTFKIKGQYRPYIPSETQNQPTSTSIPQGSGQSLNSKSCDQTRTATATSKDAQMPIAKECQLPQGSGKGRNLTNEYQHFLPSSEKTPFSAAVGQPMPHAREYGAQPITQNSQGLGRPFQPSQIGPVTGRLLTSGGGLEPQAGGNRDTTQQVIQNFKSGIPSQDRSDGTTGGTFGLDGLATRRRSSSQKGASFGHDKLNENSQNKYSSQASPARNNSPTRDGTAFILDKRDGSATDLVPQSKRGFGARPIIQNAISGKSGDLPSVKTVAQNEPAATASNSYGFSVPPQARSGHGHPIIRDSQFERTFGQEKRDDTERTSVGPGLTTTRSHGKTAFVQDTTTIDLTVSDSDEPSDRSTDAEGGYKTWIIEDPETYRARVNHAIETCTLNSATVSPLGSFRDQRNNQFDSTANPEITSDKESALVREGYGTWIIGSKSTAGSFQGSRTMHDQEFESRIGLLPHLSGSESPTKKLSSHGTSFQSNRMTDGEAMLDRFHEARVFGAAIQDSDSHGTQIQDSRMTLEHSTSCRELRDPSGWDLESNGNDRGSSRGSSPQAWGGYGGRPYPDSYGRSFRDRGNAVDRASRSNMGPLPQVKGNYGGRFQNPELHGKEDYESRSDGRLSSPIRGSFGGRKSGPNSETDRESSSNAGTSSQARANYRDSCRRPVQDNRETRSVQSRGSRSPLARHYTWSEDPSGRRTGWDGSSRAQERNGFRDTKAVSESSQLKPPLKVGADSWVLQRGRKNWSEIRPR